MSAAFGLWTSFCRLVYPDRCPLCDRIGFPAPCDACKSECTPCQPPMSIHDDEPFAWSVVLFEYDARAAQAVRALKFERSTSLADWMATLIAQAFADFRLDPDVVVPVPIHWRREAERGFNQAQLLCERLDPGLVDRRALVRNLPTRSQVGLTIDERLQNLHGAFVACPSVSGKRCVLVDDVTTSGQTARVCAQTLIDAGAVEVGLVAFCGHRSRPFDPDADAYDPLASYER